MTSKERKFILRQLKPHLAEYLFYCLLVLLMSVFSVGSILSLNNFLLILFPSQNEVVANPSELDKLLNIIYGWFLQFGRQKALIYFTILVLGIYLFKDLFTWISQYQIGRTRNRITAKIREDLYSKYTTQDVSFILSFKRGDLLSRFSSDVIEFDETVLKSYQTIINSLIVVLLYVVMLFYISYSLTLVAIVLFPIAAFVTSTFSRRLRGTSRKLQDSNAQLVASVEETISGIRIIKSLSAVDYMNNKFRDFNESFTKLRNKVYRHVDLSSPQSEFLSSIVIGAILLYGSNKVVSVGSLSSSMFIVYLIIFVLIIKPAKDASTAYYNLKKGSASLCRLMEIIDSENKIKDPIHPKAFPLLHKGIFFKDVSFAYQSSDLVLNHIDFLFEKGKTTAIVGSSGAGKSTMVDLIEKFYQLQEGRGEILFDDVSINDLTLKELRDNISFVGQDTILFNDTVWNNITFGASYNEDDVYKAVKIANAQEFIELLPQKYDTNIGDKGSMLSGGQRQRIAIARAVLKDAPILILDEATSALDTQSERKVQQSLDEISKQKTTIVIAHRLSTIINADKIIVLDKGKIVEQGTHKQLYALGGIYHNLYTLQQV